MQPDSPSTAALPDLRQILLAIWRQKKTLLIVTLIPSILFLGIIWRLPSQYSATASILVGKQELKFNNFQDIQTTSRPDDQMVQTQVSLIVSPRLVHKTIKDIHFDAEPDNNPDDDEVANENTDPVAAPVTPAAPLDAQNNPAQPSFNDVNASDDDNASNKLESMALRDLTERFIRRLDVTPDANSRVVEISFFAVNPEYAANAVNTHIRNYLEYSEHASRERTKELNDWLSKQIEILQKETVEKATAVQLFQANAGLVTGKNSEDLIYQQIADTATQLAPVQTRKMELQSQTESMETAKQEGRPAALNQIISSPLIQSLKTQEAIAAQKLQGLRSDYGNNHPSVIAARNELSQITSKISQEIAQINGSTSNDLEAVTKQEELLKGRLEELQNKANEIRKQQIELATLSSAAKSSQDALDNFMARYKEIQSQMDLKRTDAQVVSWAEVPSKPAKPKKLLMAIIAVLFSGVLGLTAVFFLEIRQTGFQNQEEVRNMLGRSPLGIVPMAESPLTLIRNNPESNYSEAIKKIYMYALMRRDESKGGKAILVTSPLPNEGKSIFVMSLAYYLAGIGKKVIVIDCDSRQPTLHGMAKVDLAPGFTDVLAQSATLQKSIVRDAHNLIGILPAGSRRTLPPDMVNSPISTLLLDTLREHYDYVLLDSPPVLALSDAGVIAGLVDDVIMVAQWSKTPKKKVEYSIKSIEDVSKPILGVVLTRVNLQKYALYDFGDAGMYYGANAKYYSK